MTEHHSSLPEELKQRLKAYNATDHPAFTWGKISEQHDSSVDNEESVCEPLVHSCKHSAQASHIT
ncbi:hypothetical protein NQZ68_013022 [Dissostichus eleginoides]|nr:hypothetical protein NQZ68_013022 [Dissostichus eleginoides]